MNNGNVRVFRKDELILSGVATAHDHDAVPNEIFFFCPESIFRGQVPVHQRSASAFELRLHTITHLELHRFKNHVFENVTPATSNVCPNCAARGSQGFYETVAHFDPVFARKARIAVGAKCEAVVRQARVVFETVSVPSLRPNGRRNCAVRRLERSLHSWLLKPFQKQTGRDKCYRGQIVSYSR